MLTAHSMCLLEMHFILWPESALKFFLNLFAMTLHMTVAHRFSGVSFRCPNIGAR